MILCLGDNLVSILKKKHDAQFGFRPQLSTECAVLYLKNIVIYTGRRIAVYAVNAVVNLPKAFDWVRYDILWDKMRHAGASGTMASKPIEDQPTSCPRSTGWNAV